MSADELFDQIVFAVATLLYGEHPGNHTINARVIAGYLRHKGVYEVILKAIRDGRTTDD